MSSVLLVGGGHMHTYAVVEARALGLRVCVVDRDADAPAMRMADERIVHDCYDADGIARIAETIEDLDGVFCVGADTAVTVAAVCDKVGLPGPSRKSAEICKNKRATRIVLLDAGVPQPRTLDPESETYPRYVKAPDSCASRGVTYVSGPKELPLAISRASRASRLTPLHEEALEGPQQSVEILFVPGEEKPRRLNIVDRFFELKNGVPIETGHSNPSCMSSCYEALYTLTEMAARAVGVRFGAFKADTILTNEGPKILEVTPRLSGGYDCQETTPRSSGRNFIRAALMLACGMQLDEYLLKPKHSLVTVCRALMPDPGIVKEILIHNSWVTPIFRVGVGSRIAPLDSCADRPGYVIASATTHDAAWATSGKAVEIITCPE